MAAATPVTQSGRWVVIESRWVDSHVHLWPLQLPTKESISSRTFEGHWRHFWCPSVHARKKTQDLCQYGQNQHIYHIQSLSWSASLKSFVQHFGRFAHWKLLSWVNHWAEGHSAVVTLCDSTVFIVLVRKAIIIAILHKVHYDQTSAFSQLTFCLDDGVAALNMQFLNHSKVQVHLKRSWSDAIMS